MPSSVATLSQVVLYWIENYSGLEEFTFDYYDYIERFLFLETFFDGCEPFTEEACRKAGENLGLVYGDNFLKGPAKTKGCYAYTSANPANAGQVFYGADGSESEMSLPVDRKSGQFRPLGHDCKSKLINLCKIHINNWWSILIFNQQM